MKRSKKDEYYHWCNKHRLYTLLSAHFCSGEEYNNRPSPNVGFHLNLISAYKQTASIPTPFTYEPRSHTPRAI